MDFHRDTEGLRDEMVPQHNFKITASSLEGRHYGEVACRDFRESVLAVMPHRYTELATFYIQPLPILGCPAWYAQADCATSTSISETLHAHVHDV